MEMEKIARWAFVAFVIIAIVMGLVVGYMANIATLHWYDSDVTNANAYVTLILLILGIVVGFISITAKEVTPFPDSSDRFDSGWLVKHLVTFANGTLISALLLGNGNPELYRGVHCTCRSHNCH